MAAGASASGGAAPPLPPRSKSILKQWLAAGVANAVTSGLLNPFDVAKTRLQTSVVPTTLRTTLRAMWAQGGVRGLFLPGLTASMVREMLSSGPRAGLYVPVRSALLEHAGGHDAAAKVAAALVTGTIGSVIANPIDVVKIRLMRDPHAYASTAAALPAIARAEGLRGLYRGLAPSTLRAAFISVGELATYDIAKTALRAAMRCDDGAPLHVAASLVTGVVASVVAAPFDLIKARAMNAQGAHEGIVSVLRALRAEGGLPGALFTGVLPAYLRLGPHALICFPIFEELRRLMGLEYL